uniref:Ribonuclease H-like domain-containing protein n=1 Tax=Tanacetum cinerariifolium TaxID=118510 RepID=A0A6L2LF78_TANCI|nr:ribonuclease H-like domain-containing protein [Tanacetum cinerariifolium]
MDLESVQNNVVAKFPLLKEGDSEMWKLRIEQYFQVQDYALWDVIENGNSFNPVPRTTANADGTSTSIIAGPITTEEKAYKKNDVKARSMLLMALPNEHLLTFGQYKDAKTSFEAIQARFDGNDATKKTQKTLLKQMYENFNAPSTQSLDSIFNRLRKIVSQLAILNLDTMSIDDIYNNFKIIEQEVKRTVTTSSSLGSQNMAFLSSPDSTNEVDTANIQVSIVSTPVNTRTGKKITINGSDTAGYDKTKVECFNCHKMRHFAKECKSLRNQESRPMNQYSSRKTVNVEDTSSKAMVAIDGAEFNKSEFDLATYKRGLASVENNLSSTRRMSRTGLEFASYKVVAPPPTGLFAPPTIDLSNSGLEKFQHPEFKGYGPKASKSVCVDTSNKIKKAPDAPIIEDWVSDSDEDESEMVQKPVLKNVEKGTGQREVSPVWNNTMRINHQNFSNSKRNFAPTAVLTKSAIVPISIARQSSSRAAAPVSADRRTNIDALKPLGNRVTSSIGKQGVNVVKSSACWVWRPKIKGDPQDALKDQGYFNSGCSRHMTRNISYLTDFKEHDGGYVAFGGGTKCGKITGKGTIKTGKLDFKDVYFVKELQFNLFCVSQMCDKKNRVLFIDTEYFVLSSNFKLANESHALLKVPRKNNMYSFDMKNIVHQKDLTFLLAKATNDESMLWHRRLGHINFKNINKLVKENLVREKGIKREYIVDRTPQQNRLAERRNRTLIELGKFDRKSDEGIFVGYSTISKAFRVYNTRTRKVEENMHITFLENKPMIAGGGPKWLFDIDALSESMNYAPVPAGTNSNDFAGKGASFDTDQSSLKTGPSQDYILMPLWKDSSVFDSSSQDSDGHKRISMVPLKKVNVIIKRGPMLKAILKIPPVNTATPTYVDYHSDPLMPDLEDTEIFNDAYDDIVEGAEDDYNNLDTFWHTASTRTLDNGKIELNTIVDGHNRTITEASVRRHLKLTDAEGINTLATTKIFTQLALMGGFSGVETSLFPTMLVTKRIYKGEGPISPVETQHTSTVIVTSPQLQNISTTYRKIKTRKRRMGIRIPQSNVPTNVADEAITKEMHDGLGRATTTASSLEGEHGSGNIAKTQTKATPSLTGSLRTSTEGGPGCHFTMRDSPVQARPERLSNFLYEPPLGEGNTSRNGEGSMQYLELMEICTKLTEKVTSLENELTSTNAVYNKALITLTKRVKKLEKQLKHKGRRSVIDSSDDAKPSLDAEDSPKKGRIIEELDKDENVNLVQSSEQGEAQETAEHRMKFSTASPQTANDETLDETLMNIKRSTTKDKGKGIMQETELPKKIKKREMILLSLDEELAQKLHAKELAKETAR